jgi:hypothetical protein
MPEKPYLKMTPEDLREIYFHENHFKSGFDEHFSENSLNAFFHYISIGTCKRFPNSPLVEAKRAAQLIGQKIDRPVLCLSGGLDSEAMAMAFIEAGVVFTAALMNLDNGLNEYDISAARYFCKKNSIAYTEIHVPALRLLEKGLHLDMAEKYRTLSPERALFIYFLQQLEGNPILAGEILRKEKSNGQVSLCCPKDRDLCYWRYFMDQKIAAVPYFHFYTPELAVSFMAHTSVKDEEKENTDWQGQHQAFYLHKLKVYQEGGFAIQDNPHRTQKWHGFEGLKKKYDAQYDSVEAYNRAYRAPLELHPEYDLNQILLIDENDSIANRILNKSE